MRSKHCRPTIERVIRADPSRKWLLPQEFNNNMNMWKLFLHFFCDHWKSYCSIVVGSRAPWEKCYTNEISVSILRPSVPVRKTRNGDFLFCSLTEWRNPTIVMTVREPSHCPVHVDISRLFSGDLLQRPAFRKITWLRDSSAQRLTCHFPVQQEVMEMTAVGRLPLEWVAGWESLSPKTGEGKLYVRGKHYWTLCIS